MSAGARILEVSPDQALLLDAVARGETDAVARLQRELALAPPQLSAEVLSVKRVPAGSGVSYGHTFVTPTETTLALVAMGYGDGLPRKAGNRASVAWHGDAGVKLLPIVGRVAMNVFVVDAGDLVVCAGDRVVLFGDPSRGELSIDEWAASVGETALSIVSSLDARVTRSVRS